MKPVSRSAQVRALDAATIAAGIAGRTLMELAGHGAVRAITARFPRGAAQVVCGPGNNGGDGYVVARLLALQGWTVELIALAPPRTEDALGNARICERMGLPLRAWPRPIRRDALVVDAIFGTGQTRPPEGPAAEALSAMAGHPAVVALDVPTGIDPDTGRLLSPSPVRAVLTVALGRWKPGLLLPPAAEFAGELEFVDLGLDLGASTADDSVDAWLLEDSDARGWLPLSHAFDAKWNRGHVAVLGDGGAAVLAAHGAFRAGVGLVSALVPQGRRDRLHGLWPEVILAEPDELLAKRHNVVVMGPGLDATMRERAAALWSDFPGGVVADANALHWIGPAPTDRPRVITPHVAEAAAMLGISRDVVESDRLGAARGLERFGTVVLKGPRTLIGNWINPTGCERLATAGTGDVLAGLIGGLMARGVAPREAAALGVWTHGRAGERMPPGGTASDLVEALRGLPLEPTQGVAPPGNR